MGKITLNEIVENIINCYEQKNKITKKDVQKIVENVINNQDFDFILQQEIEYYLSNK